MTWSLARRVMRIATISWCSTQATAVATNRPARDTDDGLHPFASKLLGERRGTLREIAPGDIFDALAL